MPACRTVLPVTVILLLAAGCSSPSAAPAEAGTDAAAQAAATKPSAGPDVPRPRTEPPQALEAPEPRPRFFHMPDEWLGRWDGPEGLFLVISPGQDTNTVRLSLKDSLDSVTEHEGVLVDDGIRFQRGGHAEIIRHGTGVETGFSDLRDRSDCLIIRYGEEGYCRREGRPRLPETSEDPVLAPAVLPLSQGVYAPLGDRCGARVPDALLRFDGLSLAKLHARACRTTLISNVASLYTIETNCLDVSLGDGRPPNERFQVAVADARHFSIRSGQVRTRYRLCPRYPLPAP